MEMLDLLIDKNRRFSAIKLFSPLFTGPGLNVGMVAIHRLFAFH